MKSLLKALAVIALVAMPLVASAQQKTLSEKLLQQYIEIVSIDHEDGSAEVQVFYMPDKQQYYLQVGHLGVGTDIVQVNFDPVYILYIPLGATLEEAQANLETLKAHVKSARGAQMQTMGCLCFGFPSEEELEPVTVTARRLIISRQLEFSVTRGDWVRAAFIPRSDMNALVNGVKFYRKIHPKEK
jgi:hypothetical protein